MAQRSDDANVVGDRAPGVAVSQGGYIKASNTSAMDWFGVDVALSADGQTMAVGALWQSEPAPDTGAVYVFRRSGGTWAQEAYIKPSHATQGFGQSLALSADGATLAVGVPIESYKREGDDGDGFETGAVYLFRRGGASWREQAVLHASNAQAGDSFGTDVALDARGEILVVGAPLEDSAATGVDGDSSDNDAPGNGAVYVFEYAGAWIETAYIKPSDTQYGQRFGQSVALDAGGATLIVGAYGHDIDANSLEDQTTGSARSFAGAAYVFQRSGSSWSQEAMLQAPHRDALDSFGYGVDIAASGEVVAVGAFGEASAATGVGGRATDDSAPWSGAAYVFSRAGTSWDLEAYIKAPNARARHAFGYSVALDADGQALLVGAPWEDSAATGVDGDQSDSSAAYAGAAYLFRSVAGRWEEGAYIKASNTDPWDFFGTAVALDDAADVLAVSAVDEDSSATGVASSGQDDNGAIGAGALYLFY